MRQCVTRNPPPFPKKPYPPGMDGEAIFFTGHRYRYPHLNGIDMYMAHHPVKHDTVLWKKMQKSANSSVKCTRKSIHKDCAAKSHVKPNNSMLCKVFREPLEPCCKKLHKTQHWLQCNSCQKFRLTCSHHRS